MFEQIVEMFENLTPILWVSQGFSFLGFLFFIISYFFKRKTYLLISAIGMIFMVIEQVLASIYSNAIATLIGVIRNFIIIYYMDKKHIDSVPYKIYIGLIAGLWIAGLLSIILSGQTTNIVEYMPLVITTIFTIFVNFKSYTINKFAIIFNETMFGVYYFINALPVSLIRQIISTGFALISLTIYFVKLYKNKKSENV